MGRAPCCDKANVKKGPWSPEEDAKLKAYIEKYGTGGNWIALPQKIGLKRCGKSCRLRWLNYLRPNIKHGGFTEEEDNTILSLYISIGSRWSIIAAQLPGRTDNDIKNYWNTRLKKKLLGRRKQQQQQHNNGSKEEELPTLSASALERLQLHMQLHGQHQEGLQNPLTLFNNAAIWPKLHPLIQEKLIQNNPHQSLIITPQMMNNNNNIPYPNYNNNNNNLDFIQQPNNVSEDHLENSSMNNGSTSSGSSHLANNTNNINHANNNINDDEKMSIITNINNNNNMGEFVGLNNNATTVSKTGGYSTGMQRVLSFQAELNELLGANDDHKVGNYGIEGINWWSNDANSATNNCWDASTTVVLQSDDSATMLYNNNQDYA